MVEMSTDPQSPAHFEFARAAAVTSERSSTSLAHSYEISNSGGIDVFNLTLNLAVPIQVQ